MITRYRPTKIENSVEEEGVPSKKFMTYFDIFKTLLWHITQKSCVMEESREKLLRHEELILKRMGSGNRERGMLDGHREREISVT